MQQFVWAYSLYLHNIELNFFVIIFWCLYNMCVCVNRISSNISTYLIVFYSFFISLFWEWNENNRTKRIAIEIENKFHNFEAKTKIKTFDYFSVWTLFQSQYFFIFVFIQHKIDHPFDIRKFFNRDWIHLILFMSWWYFCRHLNSMIIWLIPWGS